MSLIRNALLLAATSLLACGCQKSHAGGSSGSNWLRCDQLADCEQAGDAERCSADGYCEDDAGNRIEQSEPLVEETIDAGDPSDAARPVEPIPEAGSRADMIDAGRDIPEALDRCPWNVRDQFLAVGIEAPARVNCGSFSAVIVAGALSAGYSCFKHYLDMGVAAQITINRCKDCSIPNTFIGIPGTGLYELLLENDGFGDEFRMSRLSECEDIALDSEDEPTDIVCSGASELSSCMELRSNEVVPATEVFLPLEPFKIADPPVGEAVPTTAFHLYVSSQRSDGPIDIAVFIDDLQVIAGDFDPGDQHNWYAFDFTVPSGTHALRASTRAGVELEQEIDLSGERWAVIDYWGDYDGSPDMFTLNVAERAIGFD